MSLKKATLLNLKWSFIESVSLKVINFVLTIILARILVPADFGILAIINVFYLLTVSFIDGGLKEALIQKKEVNNTDYSSVFWANILLASFFYGVLFFAAPFIQDFYNISNLAFYIRLQSLNLIIDSLALVQIIKGTKDLNLKSITQSRVPASLLSFCIGIYMAYTGFGVVSLVVQQLVNSSLYVIFLWIKIKYRPKFEMKWQSLKSLYSFGLKIFAAGYLSRIYVQSMNLIYAKFFSPALLGLYTRATSLQRIPSELVVTSVVTGVYPTMVKMQDNNKVLKELYKKNVQVTFIFICGICALLFFQAGNVVWVLLGEDWMGMVPYMKVIAVGGLFLPMGLLNRNILKVKGKAGLYLNLELLRKVLTIMAVISFISTSFITVIIAVTVINVCMTLVDMYLAGKNIDYLIWEQVSDILPFFIIISMVGLIINMLMNLFYLDSIYELTLFTVGYTFFSGLIIFFFKRKFVGEIVLLLK